MHWRANMLMLRSPKAVVGFLLLSIWPMAVLLIALRLLGLSGPQPVVVLATPLPLAAGAATLVGFLFLQHLAFSMALTRTYTPFVRRAIRERGTPICMGCGQLLRGASGQRCPECGHDEGPRDESRPGARSTP